MTRDAAITLILTNVALLIAALTQGFLAWMQTRKNGKLTTEANENAAKEAKIAKVSQKVTATKVDEIHGLLNEGQIPKLLERAAVNKDTIDQLSKSMLALLDMVHANQIAINAIKSNCVAAQHCGYKVESKNHA